MMQPNPEGYPYHADDSGPWLPTTSGGVICGKCHLVIREPDFGVLRDSRRAHRATGEPMVNVNRPPAERLTPSDLSTQEKHVLRACGNGKGSRLGATDANKVAILSLVVARLVQEEPRIDRPPLRTLTDQGLRVFEMDAALRRKPEQIMAFDLGPPRR